MVNFPDYPISYSPGKTTTWLGGHSGLFGYDSNRSTRYYEYGRYGSGGKYGEIIGEKLPSLDGNYRRVPIPDLVIGPDGNPTQASLDKLKKALKERAGHNTGAELECDSEADEIKIYEKILKDAKNKARTKYS